MSEVQLFKRAFLDYLTNEFQNHRHEIYTTAYFKAIESNLVLFGWCYGHDFSVEFDSEDEYKKMVSCLIELWQ